MEAFGTFFLSMPVSFTEKNMILHSKCINWITIHPVESAIYPLNNQTLEDIYVMLFFYE